MLQSATHTSTSFRPQGGPYPPSHARLVPLQSTRLTELPGALDPKGGDDSALDTAVIVYYSLEVCGGAGVAVA